MEALREVTEWEVDFRQPNHTYLIEGDKILAYRKWHAGEVIWFKNPTRLHRTRRKFVKANIKQFGKLPEPAANTIKFTGSKGTVYVIDLIEKTCTCGGFKFRGACRHLKESGVTK